MFFPESPRVIYQKNPLIGVTCQLNFPAILSIDAAPPAAFQEKIRRQYPLYQEARINLGINLPPQLTKSPNAPIRLGNTTYHFRRDESPLDGVWTVTLTQNSLAISTSKYERWEQFRDYLASPLEALLDVYQPSFFTRIGLRYQDVLRRSTLGIDPLPWKQLLNPQIGGIFSAVDDDTAIDSLGGHAVVALGEGRKVLMQYATVLEKDHQEQCFLIDNDFFLDARTETHNVRTILDDFNQASGRLFRWFLTDSLHNALGPQPVS